MTKRIWLIMEIALALLITSCQTMSREPYPGIEVHNLHERNLYLSRSGKTDLLIFIDGSGMNSVLGIKNGISWESVEFPYFVVNNYRDAFDIAIPEKLDFAFGENCDRNPSKLSNYTVEGLVDGYAQTIDEYLDMNSYNSVTLFGISEGGLLLPKIYNQLRNRTCIRKLVVWGAGGYSQADCFRILATSAIPIPREYRKECSKIDIAIEDIKTDPHSMTKYYLGWPYNRWSSFFSYEPINEYESIDAPVLFVQGLDDYSNPAESVRYVKDTYSNKPYKYLYYKMGHVPDSDQEIKKILLDIGLWIRE